MTPPVLAVAKVMAAVPELLHTIWFPGLVTWPVGLTVMVKVCEVPAQPGVPFVKVGVTVSVAVIGALPLLVAVKEGIPVEFPALLAARPIDGVSFVQVKVVTPPVLVVAKVMAEITELLHTTWFPGLVT